MKNLQHIAITFFKEKIDVVKERLTAIPILGSFEIISYKSDGGNILHRFFIPEYNPSKTLFLLFAPQCNANTTICYTNITNGWPGIFEGYATELNIEIFHCLICEEKYEAYHFFYFYKGFKRHVLCYQDPKWVFYEDGCQLPFEDVGLYSQRMKKNRLNKKVIMRYLQFNGWDIENDNFWQPVNTYYLYKQE